MPTLILLFLLLVSVPGWAATRLVVASGGATTGDCTSTACTVDRAITQAVPGDTITLANGTYSGPITINCNSGVQNGTSLNRITLKATNERQAHLLGSGASPLQINNCSFWTVEGLHLENVDNQSTATCCQGAPIAIISSHNNIFRRLLVHHNNRWTNSHGLETYLSNDNLIEENEVYDFHRHGIIIQTGSGNIIRRNYVNSRGFPDLPNSGSNIGNQPWVSNSSQRGDNGIQAYPGSNNIMENNISEGNQFGLDIIARFGASTGNKFYGNIALDNQYGLSLTAGCDNPSGQDMPQDSVFENNVAINAGSSIMMHRGFRLRSTKNTQSHHNTVIGATDEAGWHTDLDANCPGDGAPTSFVDNLLVTNPTPGNGLTITEQNDWSVDYVNIFNAPSNTPALNDSHITHATTTDPQLGTCYAWLPDASPMKGAGLGGADIGANILYRYQDGALSSTPLWDTTTGAFTCGAVVAGVNDNDANNCRGIPNRFNINQNGCGFPAGYSQSSPSSNRLGLHVTTDELAIWRQRMVSGPYKTAGDVSTNSPGDWTTIASESATFKAAPTTDRWTGQAAATCMLPNDAGVLPRTNPDLGEPIMFAGFYAMVADDPTMRAPVLAELLYHAGQPGLDFTDTVRWCVDEANTDNPFFDVAIWLTRLLHAYDWIRPSVGSTDRSTLDQWFSNAGVFFEAVMSRTRNGWFVDPNNGDYTLTSQGTTDCGTSGQRLTHFGGFQAKNFHKHYNNRASEVAYFYAAVGTMLGNSFLSSRGALWVKEWIKYSIFADGTPSEFERWTTGIPTQGWRYQGAALANVLMLADMLCRAGDCSLYSYSTSEGVCTDGTAGGPKTLLSILTHYYSYVVPSTTRYGTDQVGNNGVAAYRIDTEDGVDGQESIRDIYSAGANLFYRDSSLSAIYRRTAVGAPAYPSSQEGCGGCYKWGGASGKWPGVLFMFGQMEGTVWPYNTPVQFGVVAKYPFTEGMGSTVEDATGRGHLGTFAPDAGWTTGLIGPYAGLFDGTRYVSISGVSELRPTTEATIGVWFKATTTDVGGSTLVALPNDGLMPYLTSLGRAACQLYDELGHFVTITSSGSYLDDVRHFLNCTYLKGDGLYLWVDHTQVGFTSLSTNINYNISGTNDVELGRSSGNTTNLNFVGSLDHITIKDTACDTACDLALFQEGLTQRRIMVLGVR